MVRRAAMVESLLCPPVPPIIWFRRSVALETAWSKKDDELHARHDHLVYDHVEEREKQHWNQHVHHTVTKSYVDY